MSHLSVPNSTDAVVGTASPARARTGIAIAPQSKGQLIVSRVLRILAQLFLVVWALVVGVPLVWTLYSSLKTGEEILTQPWALPAVPQWDNFRRAWVTAEFQNFFINTVIVVAIGLTITLILSSLVAFVLSKFEFAGRNAIRILFIIVMTFPGVLALMPLFFMLQQLGMLNSLWGLAIVYGVGGLPFSVFFLAAFFSAIPGEMMDAARVDGCSYWSTFFRIMLPLAKPGLISVGIFQFMGMWNQYILPLIMISDKKNYVLGLGVARLAVDQGYAGDWGAMFAGIVIAMLPVLIVYIIFQRRIQSGMIAGAVKN